MPTSGSKIARELFYIEDGQRQDAELHNHILDQGDAAAAKAVGQKVKDRLLRDAAPVSVYRAIVLTPEQIGRLRQSRRRTLPYGRSASFDYLPALVIQQRGTVTASTNRAECNRAGKSATRVVLRTRVPRRAIKSMRGSTVVIEGTWQWDAWCGTAPAFDDIPLRHPARKPTELFELSWDESRGFDPNEPRDDHGRWTGDGGDEGDGESEPSSKGGASNASTLYTAPAKSADQIVGEFPGGAQAINDVRERLKGETPTDAPVKDGGFKTADGSYTPERAALHETIIDHFINAHTIQQFTPPAGEQPVVTILGGRGGSGKSWLTKPGGPADAAKALLLDADAIKTMLPEYQGWNAAMVHEESSDIAALIDRRAAALGMNVILDGTLKTSNIVKRIETYKAAGDYALEGYYMYASPQVAATRAMGRFSKGGTFTGRFVPPEVILSNTNNEKNFDDLSTSMRKWAVYDNNAEGKGNHPKLVSQS